jgi:hypothetical protein
LVLVETNIVASSTMPAGKDTCMALIMQAAPNLSYVCLQASVLGQSLLTLTATFQQRRLWQANWTSAVCREWLVEATACQMW